VYQILSIAALIFVAGVACDATTPSEPVTEPDAAELHEPAVAAADRDGDGDDAKTPFDQAENKTDVGITGEIRRQVLAHDSLGTNADNAKIITANGVVTLAGQVDSPEEAKILEQIARGVPGVTQVDVQLQITPKE